MNAKQQKTITDFFLKNFNFQLAKYKYVSLTFFEHQDEFMKKKILITSTQFEKI